MPANDRDAVTAWADSGAMALSGRAGAEPLGPPAGFVERLDLIGRTPRARTPRAARLRFFAIRPAGSPTVRPCTDTNAKAASVVVAERVSSRRPTTGSR